MAEGLIHKRLKIVACGFLKKKCRDIVAIETKFRNIRSVADVCALNLSKKEIRVVEVKATYADYYRDKKLFTLEKSYFPHCHYFYIMCPTNVIPKNKVLKEFGLIYVDENNDITVVQNPVKNTKLKTRFDTTLKNACRSITNQLLFKMLDVTAFVSGFKHGKKH